jgi:hypothetical protein
MAMVYTSHTRIVSTRLLEHGGTRIKTLETDPTDATGDDPRARLDLWDYRRRVHESYWSARQGGSGEETWLAWRKARDEMFAFHSQSAVDLEDRAVFGGIPYFPYDPAFRFEVEATPVVPETVAISHGAIDQTSFRRFGLVRFVVDGTEASLTLYWLDGYGGGVFVPFRDATSGSETYSGGRYLLDTVKGADLGHNEDRLVLDFNYAYHPSCVYSTRWSCPLAPEENSLGVPIRAGERLS